MTRFVSMNATPDDQIRFSSSAANAIDIMNKLSGTTSEQILQERGPSAALLAQNFSSFGLTISECKSVIVDEHGRIVQFNVI